MRLQQLIYNVRHEHTTPQSPPLHSLHTDQRRSLHRRARVAAGARDCPCPLRDWLGAQASNIGNLFGSIRIPNFFAGTVAIEISSSNTKEDWMNAAVAKFNQAQVTTSSDNIINVTVKHVTSGGSQQAILDGKSQPTVWSPGDGSWIDSANVAWKDRTGRPLISQPCAPTVYAPIGFTMWRPMAEALAGPINRSAGTTS